MRAADALVLSLMARVVTAPVPAPMSAAPLVRLAAPVPPRATGSVPEVILLATRSGMRAASSVPEAMSPAPWLWLAAAAPTSAAARVTSALRALPFTFRVVGTAPTWAAVTPWGLSVRAMCAPVAVPSALAFHAVRSAALTCFTPSASCAASAAPSALLSSRSFSAASTASILALSTSILA